MDSAIPLAGVHHVALHTVDYEGTIRFYTELLGLSVKVEWTAAAGRRLALLNIGGGSCLEVIAFSPDKEAPQPGQDHPWMHLALATGEPDAIWQRAIDAGCESVVDPRDVSLGAIEARIASFVGPNGEVIELFHEK